MDKYNYRNPDDRWGIVPRSIPAEHTMVRPFEFQIRTLVDYDAAFLQDRVRSEVFVNGKPAGVYAQAKVDGHQFTWDRDGLRRAMEHYGPELERLVVDEFMGLGYRRQVAELSQELSDLKAYVNRLRWWHIRRHWANWRAARQASLQEGDE